MHDEGRGPCFFMALHIEGNAGKCWTEEPELSFYYDMESSHFDSLVARSDNGGYNVPHVFRASENKDEPSVQYVNHGNLISVKYRDAIINELTGEDCRSATNGVEFSISELEVFLLS